MSKASELAVLDNDMLTPAMFRNVLANGDFQLWSGGTSMGPSEVSSETTDDCWVNWYGGIGALASQRRMLFDKDQTDVPGHPTYYSRTTVTTPGAGNYWVQKRQSIEGGRMLANEWATLSFWARASGPRNIHYSMSRNLGGFAGNVSLGISEVFALTAQWQKFSRTIFIPDLSAQVEQVIEGSGLEALFTFSGSAGHGGNATINQIGDFDISRVKLERGKRATEWEPIPIAIERMRCERAIEFQTITHRGYAAAGSVVGAWVPFRQRKVRDTVVPTLIGTPTLSNCTGVSFSNANADGVVVQVTVTATGTYAFTATFKAS